MGGAPEVELIASRAAGETGVDVPLTISGSISGGGCLKSVSVRDRELPELKRTLLMSIGVSCPHCGHQTELPESHAGQSWACAACGQTITVPLAGPGESERAGASPRHWVIVPPAVTATYVPEGSGQAPLRPSCSGSQIIAFVGLTAGLLVGVGFFLALVFLPISVSREAARRTQCLQNQRNIVLALQKYHEMHNMFPMGVQVSGNPHTLARDRGRPSLGPSWWYGILPFIEQRSLYERIQATQRPGRPRPVFNAHQMDDPVIGIRPTGWRERRGTLASFAPDVMRCPSSPLPLMETQTGPILLPSYVGISGGTDISNESADYAEESRRQGWWYHRPQTRNRYVNAYKGRSRGGAIVTSSGMLPPAQHIRFADCLDGTSNTIIISEQSDWLRNFDRAIPEPYHGDPGWNHTEYGWQPRTGAGGLATAGAGGWISGTEDAGTPVGPAANFSEHSSEPGDWVAASLFNITTVRYPVDCKGVMDGPTAGFPGCGQVLGHNNPLQSPHPGGILCGLVDGSVRFVSGTTDFAVLLRLVIRNDGQQVTLPD